MHLLNVFIADLAAWSYLFAAVHLHAVQLYQVSAHLVEIRDFKQLTQTLA